MDAMRGRLRAVQLACSLAATLGAGVSAAAADCPDEGAAGRDAERGFKLRRDGENQDAAAAFEAAYRCMPDDRHGERWEHLASYLETVQKIPGQAPADTRGQLCRARRLIEDYQQSIHAVTPRPDTASDAAAEHQRIEEELARRFPGSGACDEPNPSGPDLMPVGPARPQPAAPAPGPAAQNVAAEAPVEGPGPSVDPRPAARGPDARARPLWIAGAVTGASSLIPAVIMGIGLRKGDQAELDAAAAKANGELQQIRDGVHPDGVLGNRMAYAGAIVGGALLLTSVALLTAAARRARSSRARVSVTGSGLRVSF